MVRKVVAAAIGLAIMACASCGGVTTSGPTTSPRLGSSLPATTTTHGPSSLDDLNPFFAAAADVNTKLKAAAVAVNRVISGDKIVLDQSALDAIAAADPTEAKDTIPTGLPPPLERSVLVVYNNLVSRRSAFNGVQRDDEVESVNCLRNGAAPAARFADDVKAARALAASAPPLAPVASDSQAAEELAIRFAWIDEVNNGCASCGGMVIKDLVPITIYAEPVTPSGYDRTFNGEIQGVYFTATYVADHGWNIVLNAC